MVDRAVGGGEEEGGVGKRTQLGELVGVIVIELGRRVKGINV